MVDRETIQYYSRRTGLGMNIVSKDEKISRVLRSISEWDGIDYAFKGGTAINRTYISETARFSEDLDFDLFGPGRVRDRIEAVKERLSSINGFDVKGPRMLFTTSRFDMSYVNEFDHKDKVRIDFNTAYDRNHSVKPIGMMLVSPTFLPSVSSNLRIYSYEDLLAQKIMALDDRIEGKDLYDINFMLQGKFDRDQFMQAVDIRVDLRDADVKGDRFWTHLLSRRAIFRSKWESIMNGTNHYIALDRRPEWRSFIDSTFDRIEMSVLG
jgi:predicted nucleotidyltransferase component of viral defense system